MGGATRHTVVRLCVIMRVYRSMSVTKEGGNNIIINSEYNCLTDTMTSGPPLAPIATPMLLDGPMYDATGSVTISAHT